jgi:hypothetical protein
MDAVVFPEDVEPISNEEEAHIPRDDARGGADLIRTPIRQ